MSIVQVKHNVRLNFLSIFSTYCCDSNRLEEKSSREVAVTKRDVLKEQDWFSTFPTIDHSLWLNWDVNNVNYYNLFQESQTTEPTAVKRGPTSRKLLAKEIPMREGAQKETISKEVGDCLERFFPGGLSKIGEFLIDNSFSVEKAISYFTVTGDSKQVLLLYWSSFITDG